jgi:catechol 2,3-dioxygenase-like lactoylglutathione lyase family enzyme
LVVSTGRFQGVAHIRLNVNDVSKSAEWYRDVLGFDEPRYFGELAFLRHADSGFELVMRPRRTQAGASGELSFDHVAFRVGSIAELQVWEAHLLAKGLDIQIGRAIGGVGIDFCDPDGNDLELFVPTSQD